MVRKLLELVLLVILLPVAMYVLIYAAWFCYVVALAIQRS